MSRRNLLALLSVFIILVIVSLLQTRQPEAVPIDAEATLSQFLIMGKELNMTVRDISAIRLRDPNTDLAFVISRNTSGNWTAPQSEGVLNTDTASDIAKTVVLLPYQTTHAIENDSELKGYGFNPYGILAIEILLQDNQQHAIAIGGLSPSQTVYYAVVDDNKQVYFLERAPIDYLLTQLNHPPLT